MQSTGMPRYAVPLTVTNFLLSGMLGVLMRYKILYALPGVQQAHLLHAHSHFVFFGWVTIALLLGLVYSLLPSSRAGRSIYRKLFWIFQLTALGMLITFLYQGYGAFSIIFSTLSLVVFYVFSYHFWRDLKYADTPGYVKVLIKVALLSYILSSFGTFALAYYSSHHGSALAVRSAIYFFLHFQYNGWFSFCVFALFFHFLYQSGYHLEQRYAWRFTLLLSVGLVPGYLLSIIGYFNYSWLRLFSGFAIITQLAATAYLLLLVRQHIRGLSQTLVVVKWFWTMALGAFVLKTLLQSASLVPGLANFTFSFRPLIIGYLHLVFLCMISFFLIGYFIQKGYLSGHTALARYGYAIFIWSVLANEALLFFQSLMAYFNHYHAFYNPALLYASIGIVIGLALLLSGQGLGRNGRS